MASPSHENPHSPPLHLSSQADSTQVPSHILPRGYTHLSVSLSP